MTPRVIILRSAQPALRLRCSQPPFRVRATGAWSVAAASADIWVDADSITLDGVDLALSMAISQMPFSVVDLAIDDADAVALDSNELQLDQSA